MSCSLREGPPPPPPGADAHHAARCFVYASCQNGYSTSWGVLSQNLKAGVHKDVPIGTLNLVIGLQNFAMLAASLVTGRMGDRL